jgi:predicted ester cyclase
MSVVAADPFESGGVGPSRDDHPDRSAHPSAPPIDHCKEILMVSLPVQPHTDIQSANKATAARFVGAFNRDDWDTVRDVVADDFVFHHPIGGTVEAGPEGMVATWAGFKRLSPDSWHPVPILIAEGDHVAVLLPTYGHFTGRTDQSPPPTGGRLDYGMVNLARFKAGKLAEMWFGMDPLAELQQMGMAPASPPRRYDPVELANLVAFQGSVGMRPADHDSVTAFGDAVVACSPPQSNRTSTTRELEVYRFTGGDPALVYRHVITTDPPYGGDPSVDTGTSRAVVTRWCEEVLQDHQVAALATIVSPNILVHPTAMPCEAGYYAVAGVEHWLQEQWRSFPDLSVSNESMVASGDIVATRWHARGTSLGDFMGVAPTGRSLDYSGLSMYRIEDDRIAEIWETRNTLGVLHQLDPRIGGGHHH